MSYPNPAQSGSPEVGRAAAATTMAAATTTAALPPSQPTAAPDALPARAPTPTPPAPAKRSPTPTTDLLVRIHGLDVDRVDAILERAKGAWRRGDESAISDALIEQAALLEGLGVKLLEIAGADPARLKIVELYSGLGLRALEQARKTLQTLAALRAKPPVTTAVQVNVDGGVRGVVGAGSADKLLPGDGNEE